MISRDDYVTDKQGIKLREYGSFDINAIVTETKNWFDDYRYLVQETENTTKKKPTGIDVAIAFNASRKIDDYAKFIIIVEVFMLKGEKVKVKDKSLDKGELEVTFKAYVELDYKKRWLKNKFSEFLNYVYHNYIIKEKIENVYEDKLFTELMDLHSLIKNVFEFYA